MEGPDLVVLGAVVMNRDAAGKVDVLEVGDGTVAGGAWIGGGIGLVVGLFAPPLLASTAIGAGIGAILGHFEKKHEEKELGVELDDQQDAEDRPVELTDDRSTRYFVATNWPISAFLQHPATCRATPLSLPW